MVNKSTMHLSIYQRIPMPITIYWSSDCWLLFGTYEFAFQFYKNTDKVGIQLKMILDYSFLDVFSYFSAT